MRGETRVKRGETRRSERGQSSLVSPRFHHRGVKREMGHIYRKNNNFSLSSPHDSPFHPHPRARVDFRVRTCARGVKRRMVKRDLEHAASTAATVARVSPGETRLEVDPPSATSPHGPTSAATARVGPLWATGQAARGRDGSFPALGRRRGPREQHPLETEFVSVVRSGPTGAGSPTGRDVGPCRDGARVGEPYHRSAPSPRRRTSPRTGEMGPDRRRRRDLAARIRTTFHTFARRQSP